MTPYRAQRPPVAPLAPPSSPRRAVLAALVALSAAAHVALLAAAWRSALVAPPQDAPPLDAVPVLRAHAVTTDTGEPGLRLDGYARAVIREAH
jgi:hypothetical protein